MTFGTQSLFRTCTSTDSRIADGDVGQQKLAVETSRTARASEPAPTEHGCCSTHVAAEHGLYLFCNACPGWAPAIAGRRTQLEPFFMLRAHAWVASCHCKRPDAALKAGLQKRRLQLHWEWAKNASHHTPRRKTSSYRTIPASRDAADCPACQALAHVAAVMAHRIV